MGPGRARRLGALLGLVAGAAGCATETGSAEDAGQDVEADRDRAVEHDTETTDGDGDGVDVDVGTGPASGPATFVVDEIFLLDERLCDLDGDGTLDNAVADVGLPGSQLIVAGMNTALAGSVEEELSRFLVHLPWVDDLRTPSDENATVVMCAAEDLDQPHDGSDDFSGEEPFYCRPSALDECGEPTFVFPALRIEDGTMDGIAEEVGLPAFAGAVIRSGHASGSMSPGGASIEVQICGYVRIADLGAVPVTSLEGITMLEALLAGGVLAGMPGVPGVLPDVDVDGDGIERVALDAMANVDHCVDGDTTVIEGADCWMDPRVADGISLTLALNGVPARCEGPKPGWEDHFDIPCTDPPAESLWDPR